MKKTPNKRPTTGRRELVTVDRETGEELSGLVIKDQKKGPKNLYKRWWAVNSAMQIELAMDKDLNLTDHRVFAMLTSQLDTDNKLIVCQTTLAKTLSMDKGNLSTSIKKLLEKEIIFKAGKCGRSWMYRLNPDYGWNGCTLNQHKAVKAEHDRRQEQAEKRRNEMKIVPDSPPS